MKSRVVEAEISFFSITRESETMADKRMRENNHTARMALSYYKVYYYEVANALGITPEALSLRLRREMPLSKQLEIAKVAEQIAQERGLA